MIDLTDGLLYMAICVCVCVGRQSMTEEPSVYVCAYIYMHVCVCVSF